MVMIASGIVLGPMTNYFMGITASQTAYYAHKSAVGTDYSQLGEGTKWYS